MGNTAIQEQEQLQLQLEIQQHLQLKATAAAISPESPKYDPKIAQHAEDLNKEARAKGQMPLNLFICTLADPLLAKQMTYFLKKYPMMTTAGAALRVHGLSEWYVLYVDDKDDEKEDEEEQGGSRDFLQNRRRLQYESDSMLDAVHTLLQLHASSKA
ncbi:hypothetical protein BGW39_009030 [Mortierella sp. 14UC]|nr:hypothetical protein BGW39_009030 [Mortierella sp. 14UC]